MSQQEYDDLPDQLLLRELRITVKVPSSRSKKITLVTTLTNAKKYSGRALAKLYRRRWQVEINQACCRSSGSLYLGGVAA